MYKPKILFYDIETTPLKAWVWRCGKQVVRHPQLTKNSNKHEIICIGYQWKHERTGHMLQWDYDKQCSKEMIIEFTRLCDEADLIIGKNNKRFDDKHVNTMRMMHGLDGRPDLLAKVDDLESQIRKHFKLASNTLDYISHILGLGGKDKMLFQDWIDIVEQNPDGKKAFRKMLKYCKKDVSDTVRIWKHCEKHITPKYNMSARYGKMVCKLCGSDNLKKNGIHVSVYGVKYQDYFCRNHGGYAGKRSMSTKKKILR